MKRVDQITDSRAQIKSRAKDQQASGTHLLEDIQEIPSVAMQNRYGNRATVQLLLSMQSVDQSPKEIQHIAAQGVRGTPRPLPYLNQLQKAFGSYDLSQIKAYTDPAAQQACKHMGAEGFARLNSVAFQTPHPSLHTVAHETAHIIQQHSGVHLKGGVGEAGDRYEREADSIADAVVRNQKMEKRERFQGNFRFGGIRSNRNEFNVQRELASTDAGGQNPFQKAEKVLGGKKCLEKLKKHEKIKYNFNDTQKENAKMLKVFIELYEAAEKDTVRYPGLDIEEENNIYFQFLDDIVGTNGKELPIISRIDMPGRLVQAWDFYPRERMAEKAEERHFDLSRFKTQMENNPATVGGTIAYGLGDPTTGLKTEITWQPANKMNNLSGTYMLAQPLGPDHPLGSEPSSDSKNPPPAQKARKYMEDIAGSGEKYIAGHLLNEQLGGPGNDVRNLAPINSAANALHKNEVESQVKSLVNQEHYWVWYEVKVEFKNIVTKPRFDSIKRRKGRTVAQQAIVAVSNQYVSEFNCSWGHVDKTGTKISTKQADLEFQNPIDIRRKKVLTNANLAGGAIRVFSGPVTAAGPAQSDLELTDIILTTDKKVKPKILVMREMGEEIEALSKRVNDLDKNEKEFLDIFQHINKFIDEEFFELEQDKLVQDINVFYTKSLLSPNDLEEFEKLLKQKGELKQKIHDKAKEEADRIKSEFPFLDKNLLSILGEILKSKSNIKEVDFDISKFLLGELKIKNKVIKEVEEEKVSSNKKLEEANQKISILEEQIERLLQKKIDEGEASDKVKKKAKEKEEDLEIVCKEVEKIEDESDELTEELDEKEKDLKICKFQCRKSEKAELMIQKRKILKELKNTARSDSTDFSKILQWQMKTIPRGSKLKNDLIVAFENIIARDSSKIDRFAQLLESNRGIWNKS